MKSNNELDELDELEEYDEPICVAERKPLNKVGEPVDFDLEKIIATEVTKNILAVTSMAQ